eukprot:scaffold39775_cov54-Phaeocystis_antarctica.AAC.5
MWRYQGRCGRPARMWPKRLIGRGWPRLAEACGSLEHDLALREPPGAPAGRGLSPLAFHTGRPLAVHATYQFEDQSDCAFGKRERFREWGLWLEPPPSAARSAAYLNGGGGGGGGGGAAASQEGARAADRGAVQAAVQEGGHAGGHAEETFLVLHDESTLPAAER